LPVFSFPANPPAQVKRNRSMPETRVNKVVLAYSGGLDTSIILK